MKQPEYNLQPYGGNGDTTGKRKIEWFRRQVIETVRHHLTGNAIDMGCGNGRLNTILKDHFDHILCVDPVCELDERFKYGNITYLKAGIEGLEHGREYDTVLMMGSFMIIYRYHRLELFRYCERWLKPSGKLIAMWDVSQTAQFSFDNINFRMIEDRITEDRTSIVRVFEINQPRQVRVSTFSQ